jgi:hypothetical protein
MNDDGVGIVAYVGGDVAMSHFNWAEGDLHLDIGREALSHTGTSGIDELEGTADVITKFNTGRDEHGRMNRGRDTFRVACWTCRAGM